MTIETTIKLAFFTTNNEAEYEALMAGIQLAKDINVSQLQVKSDSQLVVNQLNRKFLVKKARL